MRSRSKRRQASAPRAAASSAAAAIRATLPAVGSSASSMPALSAITHFGTCSSALPLVGSEFVATSRQKRAKFVHGAPVRRW